MLLPVFNDLLKPQWRTVLEELKRSGGLPVSELARQSGGSYMAVKIHCEALTKAGYLLRTRLPRTEVGRPEIFYSLAAKADRLFPQAGVDFTLDLLDELKRAQGASAPEKLLYQYFQHRLERLGHPQDPPPALAARVAKLVALRAKDGCVCHGEEDAAGLRLVELHNPLQRLFEVYPRAVAMEHRMLEQWLDARLVRRELPGGREAPPRVVFEISESAPLSKSPE